VAELCRGVIHVKEREKDVRGNKGGNYEERGEESKREREGEREEKLVQGNTEDFHLYMYSTIHDTAATSHVNNSHQIHSVELCSLNNPSNTVPL